MAAYKTAEPFQRDKFGFGGGFPIKRLKSKFSTTGGGEWLIAYKAEQRRRINAVLTTISDRKTRNANTADSEESDFSEAELQLNKDFILDHMHVEDCADVVEMNISGNSLKHGQPEDLQEFENVTKVVASENMLAFELFDNFKHLKVLELALNGISRLSVTCLSFPYLQVADLSYNSLNEEAILALGLLPALTELHLTGNGLVFLPSDMSRPYQDPDRSDQNEVPIVRFPCLEKLWLDDNRLTDLSTFAILAGLKRLKELNLDNNELYCIPYLKLLGINNVDSGEGRSDPRVPPNTRDGGCSRHSVFTPVEDGSDSRAAGRASCASRGQPTPHWTTPHHRTPHGTHDGISDKQSSSARPPSPPQPPLPFPCLELLSLSNNLILTADGVLPVRDWPQIKEMRIHGNPVTFTNKGMPPLIQQELVEQGNMKIVRKLSELKKKKKPCLAEKAKHLRKVPSSLPPLIPKQQPVLPALEMSSHPSPLPLPAPNTTTPLPPIEDSSSKSQVEQLSEPSDRKTETAVEESKELERTRSGVFLTQVDAERPFSSKQSSDLLDHPPGTERSHPKAESSRRESAVKQGKKTWDLVPPRYQGYEALLDAYHDPTVNIPHDMHGCTKALRKLLKHQLLLPNPKKAYLSTSVKHPSHSRLKPFQNAITSGKAADSNAEEEKGHPPLPAKVKQMEAVLSDIKDQCLELEMNLADVLSAGPTAPKPPGQPAIVKKEAEMLLDEVQKRFVKIRKAILKRQPEKFEPAILTQY